MLPSIFGESLFDEFFSDPFDMMRMTSFHDGRDQLYGKHARNILKTDVREVGDSYEVDIDLPGFKKDKIQVELKDGSLTINAAKGLDKDEQDQQGRYIRRERYVGDLQQEGISAKFEDGILKLTNALCLLHPDEAEEEHWERPEHLGYPEHVSHSGHMEPAKPAVHP